MDLLLTQYCSKPHCPHLAGEIEPHWQPPLTQQAQLWLRDDAGVWCEDAFTAFASLCDALVTSMPLLLLFALFSHSQAHPLGFLVHKST